MLIPLFPVPLPLFWQGKGVRVSQPPTETKPMATGGVQHQAEGRVLPPPPPPHHGHHHMQGNIRH